MSLMYRQRTNEKTSWHGAALLTEALILLAFLVGCLAVFFNLLASASVMGKESTQLTEAVALASNVAEEFAADPTSVRQSRSWKAIRSPALPPLPKLKAEPSMTLTSRSTTVTTSSTS